MSNWCCVEAEDGSTDVIWWPMCSINGCPNRVCTGRSDKYCYPHSTDGKTHKQLMDELTRTNPYKVEEKHSE